MGVSQKKETKISPRTTQVIVVVLLCAMAILALKDMEKATEQMTPETTVTLSKPHLRPTQSSRDREELCSKVCKLRDKTRLEYFGADLLDRKALPKLVEQAKDKLLSNLHKDYGADNFQNIFVNEESDSGYRTFGTLGNENDSSSSSTVSPSKLRLRRKLQIKILQMQKSLQQQESNVQNTCDCIQKRALESSTSTITTDDDTSELLKMENHYETYIWATGGHSSAAGHGNLFNESYTAYMSRDLKEIFGSIGIRFEGRNYAMGGTSSGSEISMCSEQIFGSDIDFLSWDYGMTDGGMSERLLHYGYRAGVMNPNHPALLAMKIGGRFYEKRKSALSDLEDLGLAVFYGDEDDFVHQQKSFPDMLGLDSDSINSLPEYVRNVNCNGQLEKGEPNCGDQKYTKGVCSPRGKQAGWHPGFKMHAMDGHGMALFLMQALLDAVDDLSKISNDEEDLESLLVKLQTEEQDIIQSTIEADLPEGKYEIDHPELNETLLFYTGPSLCHTGRLPAKTRYLGYLSDNGKVGDMAPLSHESYETGIEVRVADRTDANGILRLTYADDKDREKCNVLLKPDYKDFFYAHQRDGWVKLNFPNKAEKAAYGYDPDQFKGVLGVFFKSCDWGKCQKNDFKHEQFVEGRYEIKVNGESVQHLVDVGAGLYLLKGDGERGLYWEPSAANQDYEISFQVNANETSSYVKISSLVLY